MLLYAMYFAQCDVNWGVSCGRGETIGGETTTYEWVRSDNGPTNIISFTDTRAIIKKTDLT